MKKVVIATKNEGKLREMKQALGHLPVEIVSLADFGALPDAVEDADTFLENARIKARFFMEQTGCACIADDSGLEVAALGGAPGVHSARFAGFHADDGTNNEKLLAELRNAGVTESDADYRCALVFMDTDGQELHADGRCDGVIRMTAKGSNGFGYDPYFYVAKDRTMAELSLEEKDRISHRGAALRRLVQLLEEYLK
ncbi:MAG: RdgB/HAM1 family non-canonical purine NTP pyrophosphatase [Selenomonadaceae bacterium]|nr:RdgB/HAM1 family non-canonical purine NTP pyrophosphatase [Selenomonadaceae bacterium]